MTSSTSSRHILLHLSRLSKPTLTRLTSSGGSTIACPPRRGWAEGVEDPTGNRTERLFSLAPYRLGLA